MEDDSLDSRADGLSRRLDEVEGAELPGFEQERVRRAVEAQLFGMSSDPVRIGRFAIERRLGSGGMGIVYLARDEELERAVALKLLHRRRPAAEQVTRLRREAQSLARVSHPNVVQVYEVGEYEDQIFVAMELVEGSTLREWNEDASLDEVLEVFVQAGQGLAAAHVEGLVHRDFKPENVLVGADGRVRVVDFGLAREPALDPELDPDSAGPSGSGPRGPNDLVHRSMTRSGATLGTPAYMSPEQHVGEAVDHRSDQFSFCVALWERVYGERPFRGASAVELAEAVLRGEPEITPGRAVPRWLVRALRKGLSTHPEARHASMDELIGLLVRRQRRSWGLLGASLIAAVAVGAGAAVAMNPPPVELAPPCPLESIELDGVWDDEVRQRIEASFLATGVPRAPEHWERTRRNLEDQTTRLLASRGRACHEARKAELDPELIRIQQSCFDAHRRTLEVLSTNFQEADGPVVRRAVVVTNGLLPPESCEDALALRQDEDEDQREVSAAEGSEEMERLLARSFGRLSVGRHAEALELARRAGELASRPGQEAVRARAELGRGRALLGLSRNEEAFEALRRAQRLADRGSADRIRAEAAVWAVFAGGLVEPDYERALDRAEDARAAVARLGGDAMLEAVLADHLGTMARKSGRWSDAVDFHREALRLREEVRPPGHLSMAVSHEHLGNTLNRAGEYGEAELHLWRAVELFERNLGPDAINTAYSLTGLGNAVMWRAPNPGSPAHAIYARQAEPLLRHSVRIRTLNFGEDELVTAIGRHHLGESLLRQGKLEAARETFEHVVDCKRRGRGGPHADVAFSRVALARTLLALDRPVEALEAVHTAIETYEATASPDPLDVGEARFTLARALAATGGDGADEAARSALDTLAQGGPRALDLHSQVEAWIETRQGRAP